ncbi:putative MFS-type transporter [Saccharolobus shibatae B12]|uniref:MFS-type transporter n=1 Tax=Saccharolobus shibatae (strain ATCC 51178 / DSM 5389 / JCM 8931 / NBRC 15437 / B12) TaxID=523848 RepID=A0A8F5GTG0_SACSH|nr:MFS transporter [Saccharolobus shibatae]QXJ28904.1 putative MFS-type transporter [Saccharolobus shibatae B12]
MEKIPANKLAKYISLASIGTLVEWYDLFVVGVAASLIWPTLFYPKGIGAAALAASISTYGSIYFTRPIGAIIFGHFGDKIGRKTMLIWTLLLSSIGMIGMALTPPFVSIGLLAPILILIFRLIQGIGLGGEYGGAATILIEYTANTNRRAYYSSFLQATVPLGALFAILGLFLGRTYMTAAEFATIGWRILLGIGAVALIIGGFIRYVLMESPLFQELLKKKEIEKAPVTTVLKEKWKTMILLGLSWAYIVTIFAIIYFPTGLSYMASLKISLGIIYSGLFAGAIGGIIGNIVGGRLGDIIGRKKVMIISAILTAIFSYSYFPLVGIKIATSIILANFLLNFSYFLGYGVVAAFFTEHFLTKYRYTGAGFSYQIAAIVTGIYTSLLLPTAIVVSRGIISAVPYIIVMSISLVIIAILSLIPLKETKNISIS